jgi:hypothetical protein
MGNYKHVTDPAIEEVRQRLGGWRKIKKTPAAHS